MSEDVEMSDHECHVCTDVMEEDSERPECGHMVHMECIARSGQNMCPLCRREVTFTGELQELYERQRASNAEDLRQRESNESLALARQLQNTDEPRRRRIRVNIFNQSYVITFQDVTQGAVSADDLMLQLNLIVYNVTNRVREFEVDERAWQLYQLMTDMNQISANTGLSMQQLCSIIENNSF